MTIAGASGSDDHLPLQFEGGDRGYGPPYSVWPCVAQPSVALGYGVCLALNLQLARQFAVPLRLLRLMPLLGLAALTQFSDTVGHNVPGDPRRRLTQPRRQILRGLMLRRVAVRRFRSAVMSFPRPTDPQHDKPPELPLEKDVVNEIF